MIYPKHIAIIPDWNRSWAKKNGLPEYEWHLNWAHNWLKMIRYAFESTKVDVVTWWFLSTENLHNRSESELEFLFGIFKTVWEDFYDFLRDQKINFKWIGNPEWLPADFVEFLRKKESEFKFDSTRYAVFAVNYWWRDEIIRWIKKLNQTGMDVSTLTEESFSSILDLWDLPVVDLVIRTKWDMAQRTSGFLSWWIWYAELYFTDLFFPDFNESELDKAFVWFDDVSKFRNFGK